jgi:hypothetical protein
MTGEGKLSRDSVNWEDDPDHLSPSGMIDEDAGTLAERSDEHIDQAEQILTASHEERLRRWRRFAQEARRAHARGETFRLPRRRITGPLRAAVTHPPN